MDGNKVIFNLYPQNEAHKEEKVRIQGTVDEVMPLEFIGGFQGKIKRE
jgi:hypothetical protein